MGVRNAIRILSKPSTEIQADALALLVGSVLLGGLSTVTLGAVGADRRVVTAVGVALTIAAIVSAFVVLRKLTFERHYGDFFMASTAVASDDLVSPDGSTLARRAVDEVCEMHVIGGLARMAKLNRQGARGRMRITLSTLRGISALVDDFDDPVYSSVVAVTARSDLVGFLFKIGFTEITDPPRYDLANRIAKRLDIALIRLFVNHGRHARPEEYRLAFMRRDQFAAEDFRLALDAQLDRVAGDIARLEERLAPKSGLDHSS